MSDRNSIHFAIGSTIHIFFRCLQQRVKLHGICHLDRADSWHQDSYNNNDEVVPTSTPTDIIGSENSEESNLSPNEMNILQLNDYCLIMIFELVSLADLVTLKRSCVRIQGIVDNFFKRYKFFDADKHIALDGKRNITLLKIRNILMDIGPYTEHLCISLHRFRQPGERILMMISRHCTVLKKLEIKDIASLNLTVRNCLKMISNSSEELTIIGFNP